MKDSSRRGALPTIGVKRLGGLHNKPFIAAAKRKFPDEASVKARELWSMWDSHLRDPSWHPFKVITDKGKAVVWKTDPFISFLNWNLLSHCKLFC